jgi:hypothetical protein
LLEAISANGWPRIRSSIREVVEIVDGVSFELTKVESNFLSKNSTSKFYIRAHGVSKLHAFAIAGTRALSLALNMSHQDREGQHRITWCRK